jgi:microcystin-dependent protein
MEAELTLPECNCTFLAEKALFAFKFLPELIIFCAGTVTEIVTTLS